MFVVCLMFISWLGWGYGYAGGEPQRLSAILSASYQRYMLLTCLIAVDINLDHWAEILFGRLLQLK